MIIGCGTDIIEIERINEVINRTPRFLQRVFNSIEREYFATKQNMAETVAGCFAAKEAVVKAVGGTIFDVSLSWDSLGKPCATTKYAPNIKLFVSISHCKHYAVANAVAIKE